jgi:hypothetical protein
MKKVYVLFSLMLVSVFAFSQYASKKDEVMGRVSKPSLSEMTVSPVVERGTMATIFSEGFEWTNMPENGWTTLDQDGDEQNWFVYTASGAAHSGAKCVASASWTSSTGALNPTNWIITPQIALPASGTIMLNYWIGAQDPAWPQERYKVAISTTNTNPSSFTIIHAETLTSGGWKERSHNLSSYAGQNVYIAFIHTECTDMFYLKLDDVTVYTNETNDAAVLDIIEPNHLSGCQLSSNQNITIRIQNNGGSDISGFQVAYSVNGGTPVVETVTATIIPAAIYEYTFAATVDMSVLGSYNIVATVNLTGDSNPDNNTAGLNIISGDAVIAIDAFTDNMGGQSWQVINKLTNQVVAERTVGWQWNVTVHEEVCVIDEFCYKVIVSDEDGMEDPAWVTISYNSIVVAGSITPGSFTGPQLVADNLGSGCAAIDAELYDIEPIFPACEMGDETLTVYIKNNGTNPFSNFTLSYTVNGGSAVTENFAGTINPGNAVAYTFTTPINMADDGIYEIVASVNVTGDEVEANNSLEYTTANLETSNVPYSSNFDTEVSLLGWAIVDANNDDNSWVYATGFGVGGTNAIAYVYDMDNPANDWLFSTCIDLTGGQAYRVSLDYKVQSATYPEKLAIYYGNAQDPSAMNLIVDLGTLTNTEYQTANANFTPSANGTYYIGIKAYSDADMWNLFVDNFAIDVVVSSELVNAAAISVYPNPANDFITVVNAEGASIEIINMLGSVVAKVNNASANQQIDINNLTNGTYFVKVNGEVFKLNVIK